MVSLLPDPEPADPVEGALGHFEHTNWVKKALKNLDNGTVHQEGSVVTGELLIDNAGSDQAWLLLKGDDIRAVTGQSNSGHLRWVMVLGTGAAETGNNTGSLFELSAHGDDGVKRFTVLKADRYSGLLLVAGNPTSPLGIATKTYVDSSVPLGAITAYKAAVAPNGWHLCDGSLHGSSPLAALIGSASTPDLRASNLPGCVYIIKKM